MLEESPVADLLVIVEALSHFVLVNRLFIRSAG